MAIQLTQNDALIVVDMQNDFMPKGSLPVTDGDLIVPLINRLLPCFSTRVFTRDWHPPDHISFSKNPTFTDQSWPSHCVRSTPGADFHPDLNLTQSDRIISKATETTQEAYSGFQQTDLSVWLKQRSIQRVFITGVAIEYCVKSTAQDSHVQGFETIILQNAVKGINQPEGSAIQTLQSLQANNIQCINTKELQCP